jgi:hypothetical protein
MWEWIGLLALSLTLGCKAAEFTPSQTISLDGDGWRIAIDPKNEGREAKWFGSPREEAKPTKVPATIQQSFPGYHGAAWYWSEFASPAAAPGHRWRLCFGAVDYFAEAWLNGTRLGDHEGSDAPFEFDITEALRVSGKNLLAVRVINPGHQPVDGFVIREIPHSFKNADHYAFGGNANSGGILLPVELRRQPVVRVTDVFAQADPATGQVRLQVTVDNSAGAPAPCEIAAAVDRRDSDREVRECSGEQRLTVQPGATLCELTMTVHRPRLWSPQEPNLYAAEVVLGAEAAGVGPVAHRTAVRFGFRDFRVGADGFFRLNGRRLFLKSCHTVNNFPVAIGMPHKPELMTRDLLYAKAMGFDMVRFLGGPPFPEQLRFCDEIGLMIYAEPRAAWALSDSPKMAERFDRSVTQMILRDRNHPCITIWGLLNETGDGPVSRHAAESLPLVRKLDPTRLVLFNSGRWDLAHSGGGVFAKLDWWRMAGDEPWAARNPSKNPVETPFNFIWPPGQAALHPGPRGEYSVARWTSPAADRYTVAATFAGMARATTDVHVLHNGRSLFDGVLNIGGQPNTATHTGDVTLAKGDTVDFVVGWGNESHSSDSTAVTATIKSASGTFDFAADFPRDRNPAEPWSCGTFAPGKQPLAATFVLYNQSRSSPVASVSNPAQAVWEYLWGDEQPNGSEAKRADGGSLTMGDLHNYPAVPHDPGTIKWFRTISGATKPIFLSEYGVGSLVNPYRIARLHDQNHTPEDALDFAAYRSISERLTADLKKYGMDGLFAFPEDLILASERMHARHRTMGYNAIRANPRFCGYSLTGIIDQPAGEGLMTEWRELKQGIMDAMNENLAPLRWCLFVEPMHVYAGRAFHIEAVMANDGILASGEYPVRLKLVGPHGVAWEKASKLVIPAADSGDKLPLVTPVLAEIVTIDGPAGVYTFAAELERGGAARGGRFEFYLSRAEELPRMTETVAVLGISNDTQKWLKDQGVVSVDWNDPAAKACRVILVGDGPGPQQAAVAWREMAQRIATGDAAVFLKPSAFAEGKNSTRWLPLKNKGVCRSKLNWVYHCEDVAKQHPVFEDLPAGGMLNWYYYLQVAPNMLFEGQDAPDDAVAAAFGPGDNVGNGYNSGILAGVYRLGSGRFLINTLRILENLNANPAADRLLLNMIRTAATVGKHPRADLPPDFEKRLKEIGY